MPEIVLEMEGRASKLPHIACNKIMGMLTLPSLFVSRSLYNKNQWSEQFSPALLKPFAMPHKQIRAWTGRQLPKQEQASIWFLVLSSKDISLALLHLFRFSRALKISFRHKRFGSFHSFRCAGATDRGNKRAKRDSNRLRLVCPATACRLLLAVARWMSVNLVNPVWN